MSDKVEVKSQARELEKNAVLSVMRLSNNVEIQKFIFTHYWKAFYNYFRKRKGQSIENIRELYAEAYARFRTDVAGRYAPTQSQPTVLENLLLIGKIVLREQPKAVSFGNSIKRSFTDSELLLKLIKLNDNQVILALQKLFGRSFVAIFADRRGIDLDGATVNRLMDVFPFAYLRLVKLINDGKYGPPLTATLHTYFYRVYERVSLEEFRKHVKSFSLDKPGPEDFVEPQAPLPANREYLDWVLETENSLNRFDFKDAGALVTHLLGKLDERCATILRMHYIQGMTFIDIGTVLELSNVKMIAHRCRKTLVDLLNPIPNE